MIIFLYGSDAYRIRQHAQTLLDRYTTKYPSGLNLLHIDMRQPESLTLLQDALKSVSFFEEIKLIVLKNSFHKTTATKVHELFKEQDVKARKDIVVMLWEELGEKEIKSASKDFFTYSTANTTVGLFDVLQGAALTRWINQETERLGCSIMPAAIAELTFRAGTTTWALALELQKLANYKISGIITPEDVSRLVSTIQETNIFDLTDAVGSRNPMRATALLYHQLHTGEDPYYILTMLIFHVRNLLALRDLHERQRPVADAAKLLGMHPFVARKTNEQAIRFSFPELKKLFSHLSQLEQETKRGTVQLTDELYRVIVS
jgi:DNA polymerase III subunit delta